MTNQQLYLAIGIPILFNSSVVFILFQMLNARVGKVDDKVDASRLEVVSRIDRLDGKVDGVRLELVSRIDRVADATATFYRELGKHEAAIDKLQSN